MESLSIIAFRDEQALVVHPRNVVYVALVRPVQGVARQLGLQREAERLLDGLAEERLSQLGRELVVAHNLEAPELLQRPHHLQPDLRPFDVGTVFEAGEVDLEGLGNVNRSHFIFVDRELTLLIY